MTFRQAELGYPIFEHTLTNGLRVIVNPDHSAPVIAINLWYDVGSRDEAPGATGVAHLFEHLMFQGSANVLPGEHLSAIQNIGGSANATTSFDRTNYFETVPTGALDLGLWLESDRMATLGNHLSQTSLDTQRDVVKEEKRQRYDNVPYGNVMPELLSLTFPDGHPYHHATIGSMADLDSFSLADAKAFFNAYYAPNNAVLTLVGDIEPDDAFSRVTKYFDGINPIQLSPRPEIPALPPFKSRPSLNICSPVPANAIYFGWPIPKLTNDEYPTVDLAGHILGGGHTSRWYRRLLRFEELVAGTGAATLELAAGNSLGYGYARALPGGDLDPIKAILLEETEKLGTTGPSAEEMARSLVQAERLWLSLLSDFTTRADQLSAHALLFNDPKRINTRLLELTNITAADVQNAAAKYLINPAILTIEVCHE